MANTYSDIIKKKAREWDCKDLMSGAHKERGGKIPFSSPLLNYSTYGGIPRNMMTEFFGEPSGGKAQPLYSKILTPNGYVNMGDIKIGDKVFDGHGGVCEVDGVFPQGSRPVYEITLQDGTSFRVADNHLNSVWWYDRVHSTRVDEVLTTCELIEKKEYLASRWSEPVKIRIDIPEVDWPNRPVLIDPYLLGALIGDGSLSGSFAFTNGEQDVVKKVDNILRRDWRCKLVQSPYDKFNWDIQCVDPWYPKTILYKDMKFNTLPEFQDWLVDQGYDRFDYATIRKLANNESSYIANRHPELYDIVIVDNGPSGRAKLISALDSYGLMCKSINKHIPEEYLYNDFNTRIELARGLFDTDGYSRYVPKLSISCDWTTSSSQLSYDCEFLFRSLGIRDTVKRNPGVWVDDKGNRHKVHDAYTHYLHVPNDIKIFSSNKHRNNYKDRKNPPFRAIESIQFAGHEECQCIHVSSPHHTYVTDNFTLTHNTTTAVDIGKNAFDIFKEEHQRELDDLRKRAGSDKAASAKLADLEDRGPKKVLYIDLEHSFDQAWANTLGIDDGAIDIMQPPDVVAEDILNTVLQIIETGEVGLVVLDSIPSLVPQQELDKKLGERTVASLAGLLTVFCRKVIPLLTRYECTMLIINQTRDNMDNPYVVNTPGGKALKFYCALRMLFRIGSPVDFLGNELPSSTENPAGYIVNAKIVKQKSAPWDRRNGSYYLMAKSGIRIDMDYANLAVKKYGIIAKAGAWYTLCVPQTGEVYQDENGNPVKLNGMAKVFDFLQADHKYYNMLKTYILADIEGRPQPDLEDILEDESSEENHQLGEYQIGDQIE